MEKERKAQGVQKGPWTNVIQTGSKWRATERQSKQRQKPNQSKDCALSLYSRLGGWKFGCLTSELPPLSQPHVAVRLPVEWIALSQAKDLSVFCDCDVPGHQLLVLCLPLYDYKVMEGHKRLEYLSCFFYGTNIIESFFSINFHWRRKEEVIFQWTKKSKLLHGCRGMWSTLYSAVLNSADWPHNRAETELHRFVSRCWPLLLLVARFYFLSWLWSLFQDSEYF